MEFQTVTISIPQGCNCIFGQTHFIKTVEDLYEIMRSSCPQAKFGLAFTEASGDCLIRFEGNDQALQEAAVANLEKIAAGHLFLIFLKDAFPINVLNAIKACPEVCSIFCATANPVEVVIAETAQGRGVMGVIDGYRPKGIEQEKDRQARHSLLRKLSYKL
ncbi:MAG: adenosine-specific kinase [bacterium]|nr:adenosine-specific kinase [bacterium]